MNWYKLAQDIYTMPTGVPYIDRERDGTGLLTHYPREDDEVGDKKEKEKNKNREKKILRKRKGPDFRPENDSFDLELNRRRQNL